MTDNPDTCTPPTGTPDGTWHWLSAKRGTYKRKRWWTGENWKVAPQDSAGTTPFVMDQFGWRYIGPVEPPQSVAVPSAADALLREVMKIYEKWKHSPWNACEPDAELCNALDELLAPLLPASANI